MWTLIGNSVLTLAALTGAASAQAAMFSCASMLEGVFADAPLVAPPTPLVSTISENLPLVDCDSMTLPEKQATADPRTAIDQVFYSYGVFGSASELTVADLRTTQSIQRYGFVALSIGTYANFTGKHAAIRYRSGSLQLLLPSAGASNANLVAQVISILVQAVLQAQINGSVSNTMGAMTIGSVRDNGYSDPVIGKCCLDIGNISLKALGTKNKDCVTRRANSATQGVSVRRPLAGSNATRQISDAVGSAAVVLCADPSSTDVVGTVRNGSLGAKAGSRRFQLWIGGHLTLA